MSRDELPTSDVKGKNPFKDLRVREAFALAIDEDLIAQRVMLGLAHPTWLMWGPGVNGYDAKLDVRPKPDVGQGEEAAGRRRLSATASRVALGLPERPLRDGRADLHRHHLDAGAHRHQGRI